MLFSKKSEKNITKRNFLRLIRKDYHSMIKSVMAIIIAILLASTYVKPIFYLNHGNIDFLWHFVNGNVYLFIGRNNYTLVGAIASWLIYYDLSSLIKKQSIRFYLTMPIKRKSFILSRIISKLIFIWEIYLFFDSLFIGLIYIKTGMIPELILILMKHIIILILIMFFLVTSTLITIITRGNFILVGILIIFSLLGNRIDNFSIPEWFYYHDRISIMIESVYHYLSASDSPLFRIEFFNNLAWFMAISLVEILITIIIFDFMDIRTLEKIDISLNFNKIEIIKIKKFNKRNNLLMNLIQHDFKMGFKSYWTGLTIIFLLILIIEPIQMVINPVQECTQFFINLIYFMNKSYSYVIMSIMISLMISFDITYIFEKNEISYYLIMPVKRSTWLLSRIISKFILIYGLYLIIDFLYVFLIYLNSGLLPNMHLILLNIQITGLILFFFSLLSIFLTFICRRTFIGGILTSIYAFTGLGIEDKPLNNILCFSNHYAYLWENIFYYIAEHDSSIFNAVYFSHFLWFIGISIVLLKFSMVIFNRLDIRNKS